MAQTAAVLVLDKTSSLVVVAVVCLGFLRMVQSLLEEWQGSRNPHHRYPISSARGEACGLCQGPAGYSKSSMKSKAMIRVA